MLAMLVCITYATEVYFTDTALFEPFNSLVVVALCKTPEMSKVVHQSVGYDAKRNTLTHLAVCLHKTINSIVESRVATHNDNSFIAIVYHHLNKTIHTGRTFALHKVVFNIIGLKTLLYLLPTMLRTEHFMLRAVEYAPTVVVYHIIIVLIVVVWHPPSGPLAMWHQSNVY